CRAAHDRCRDLDAADRAVRGRPARVRPAVRGLTPAPPHPELVTVCAAVRRSFYQDSIVLMAVAGRLRGEPGVREAAALMGTPANHAILAAAGLAAPEVKDATPGDLVIVVQADSEADAQTALQAAGAM